MAALIVQDSIQEYLTMLLLDIGLATLVILRAFKDYLIYTERNICIF